MKSLSRCFLDAPLLLIGGCFVCIEARLLVFVCWAMESQLVKVNKDGTDGVCLKLAPGVTKIGRLVSITCLTEFQSSNAI